MQITDFQTRAVNEERTLKFWCVYKQSYKHCSNESLADINQLATSLGEAMKTITIKSELGTSSSSVGRGMQGGGKSTTLPYAQEEHRTFSQSRNFSPPDN